MLHDSWLLVLCVIVIGSTIGYLLGKVSVSRAPVRVHKTIDFDRRSRAEDEELDAAMEANNKANKQGQDKGNSKDNTTEEPGATNDAAAVSSSTAVSSSPTASARPRSGSTSSSGSDERKIAAEDADEDLQTILEHMKTEHAAHLTEFAEGGAAAAAAAAHTTPDPASPTPFEGHRRIFIVAKALPLQISNLTGLPTPSQTPFGSPLTGPTPQGVMSHSTSIEELNLEPTAAAAAAAAAQHANHASDTLTLPPTQRHSVHAAPSSSNVIPSSGVIEGGGFRFKVEWEDSRSFLSNLRCLLTPRERDCSTSHSTSHSASSSPSPSPLVSFDQAEVNWIGLSNVTSASSFKSAAERAAYESALKVNHCIPVYMDTPLLDGYLSFCRSILWPLLHYMMPTNTNMYVGERWGEYWTSYENANAAFADTIVSSMKSPNDIIWIQNMHLFSLPALIRARMPRATIGLFIHTPFPSSDVFRSLPSRRDILESMMDADLLGFHTFDYARHFLSCIKRVMDLDFETLPGGLLGVRYNGRFVSILISHVGIQSNVFKELAESELLKRRVEKLRSQFPGKKLVIGVDDIDLAKAPILKLQAFDRFLSRHPEWVEKIVILEMFLPSKNMDSELGMRIQKDLDDYILDLKHKYGENIIKIIAPFRSGGPPSAINEVTNAVDQQQQGGGLKLIDLVRLYNAADVAIIASGFEGLNLIPFEFTASQSEKPGALIISEFMGCSRSLNGVLRVNPWSLETISDALHTALSMSNDERRANHSRRYNYVMNHTIERWANGFLEQLERATKLGAELNYVTVTHGNGQNKLLGLRSSFMHLPITLVTNHYAAASLRVLFLDYDGTLVHTDKSASACGLAPPSAVIKLLKFLSEDPRTVVFIMSGRPRAVLQGWFGELPNLGLAAEKGLFLKFPQRLAAECRFDIKRGSEKKKKKTVDAVSEEDEDEEDEDIDDDDDDEDEEESDLTDAASYSTRSTQYVVEEDWECIVPLDDISWKSPAREIIASYTAQTDGSWIEDKEFAIVWHYEQADVEYGRMQASDLQKFLVKVLANPKVDVLRYDKSRILEVKPHGVNKGLACTAILESLWMMSEKQRHEGMNEQATDSFASSSSDSAKKGDSSLSVPSNPSGSMSPRSQATHFHPFVFAIGDDRSDEDMFVSIQQKLYLDGKIRGRDSGPSFDSGYSRSVVHTSAPQSHSISLHDPETSPSPLSPSMGSHVSARLLAASSPPSSDPFLFTVCVGMKPSNAHYFVNNPEEALRSLYGLVLRDQEEYAEKHAREAAVQGIQARMGVSKRSSMQNAANTAAQTAAAEQGMGPKRGSFGMLTKLFGNTNTEKKE